MSLACVRIQQAGAAYSILDITIASVTFSIASFWRPWALRILSAYSDVRLDFIVCGTTDRVNNDYFEYVIYGYALDCKLFFSVNSWQVSIFAMQRK